MDELSDLPPTPVRGGALAYKDDDGVWRSCVPGEPSFSIFSFVATHYYTEEYGWQPIVVES